MEALLRKVNKELETIADKGITSSNLDATYKLIDIYKDIKEICKMEDEERYGTRGGRSNYGDKYYIERFNDNDYNHHPTDEKTERYLTRMREGMVDYNAGRMRYRDGGTDSRMIDGIEMTMSAVVNFVENLIDYAETSQEKEIVRKYVNKLKNV